VGTATGMNRLRHASLTILAAACLAGLPACDSNDAKRDADKAGQKAQKAGKKAANKAEKAKKDVDGK
jgi:hypothetical protein